MLGAPRRASARPQRRTLQHPPQVAGPHRFSRHRERPALRSAAPTVTLFSSSIASAVAPQACLERGCATDCLPIRTTSHLSTQDRSKGWPCHLRILAGKNVAVLMDLHPRVALGAGHRGDLLHRAAPVRPVHADVARKARLGESPPLDSWNGYLAILSLSFQIVEQANELCPDPPRYRQGGPVGRARRCAHRGGASVQRVPMCGGVTLPGPSVRPVLERAPTPPGAGARLLRPRATVSCRHLCQLTGRSCRFRLSDDRLT